MMLVGTEEKNFHFVMRLLCLFKLTTENFGPKTLGEFDLLKIYTITDASTREKFPVHTEKKRPENILKTHRHSESSVFQVLILTDQRFDPDITIPSNLDSEYEGLDVH